MEQCGLSDKVDVFCKSWDPPRHPLTTSNQVCFTFFNSAPVSTTYRWNHSHLKTARCDIRWSQETTDLNILTHGNKTLITNSLLRYLSTKSGTFTRYEFCLPKHNLEEVDMGPDQRYSGGVFFWCESWKKLLTFTCASLHNKCSNKSEYSIEVLLPGLDFRVDLFYNRFVVFVVIVLVGRAYQMWNQPEGS